VERTLSNRYALGLVAGMLVSLGIAGAARGERIKDIVEIQGIRGNPAGA